MTNKSVYLAGPIAGLTVDDADEWRKYARDVLRTHNIDGMSPLRGKAYLRTLGSLSAQSVQEGKAGLLSLPRSIMTRDLLRCDALRRIAGQPITGTPGKHRDYDGSCVVLSVADPYRLRHGT